MGVTFLFGIVSHRAARQVRPRWIPITWEDFVGIGDILRKILKENGTLINEYKYADGAILNICKYEKGYLIEYSRCDMNSNHEENLICIDFEGNELWKFPRESDQAVVTRFENRDTKVTVWTK